MIDKRILDIKSGYEGKIVGISFNFKNGEHKLKYKVELIIDEDAIIVDRNIKDISFMGDEEDENSTEDGAGNTKGSI